ncbi:NAD(P)H-binding protein [Micromonospora sp. NPDC049559]|uniref:NAD(P)H-binding protein n=1 Tax=Micromonospora sp. NPDC049559 TaxID=3155923 RepID=UPI003435CBD4
MTILVTGATGQVGRLVTDQLVRGGEKVRALVPDWDDHRAVLPSGVQVCPGDLTAPETLREALAGVDRLYLFPIAATAPEVAALARQAGVRHVVVLSAAMVTDGVDTSYHVAVERAVEAAGLSWTHVRPSDFALNTVDLWAESIRTEATVRVAYPDVPAVPVHEADIASVAVAALLDERHAGRAYTVTGPTAVSQREQARQIGLALGRDIRVEELTPEQARADMVRRYIPEENADHILNYLARWAVRPPTPLPTVREVTGRAGRDFARWARDHVADFR